MDSTGNSIYTSGGTKYEGYNLLVEISILVDSKLTYWSEPTIPLSKQEIGNICIVTRQYQELMDRVSVKL